MTGLLLLETVCKSFDGVTAIAEVSFSVAAGEIVAVTGTGKTTLLELIAGALRPDQGSIRFGGAEIAGLAPERIAALGIARVFDPPRPFAALSLEDNVVIGALLREPDITAARRRAREILEGLGLAAGRHRPASTLQPAGRHRPASTLQPAGRKRLELARALATRPRLLLLDEMLTGLPAEDAAALARTLGDLARRHGLTLLLAEHDPAAAALFAGRVLELDHGRLPAASGEEPA